MTTFILIVIFILVSAVYTLRKRLILLMMHLRQKMKERSKEEFQMKLFVFMIIKMLSVFFILAILMKNREFIYYDAILLPLIVLAYALHKKIRLHLPIFALLCVVIFLHMAGGVLKFDGIRLYDIHFQFIKYDNIVHFTGAFTIVFVVYNLIYPYLREYGKEYNIYLFLILILMSAGSGTLIEMVELLAVVLLDAGKGVGGYMNNAIDLVVNLLGAISGAFLVCHYHKKKTFKEGLLDGKFNEIFKSN